MCSEMNDLTCFQKSVGFTFYFSIFINCNPVKWEIEYKNTHSDENHINIVLNFRKTIDIDFYCF